MSEETVIRIADVKKVYDVYENRREMFWRTLGFGKKDGGKTFRALNGVSFDVKRGETMGIIGTNGAGKSTLLKMITGVLEQTEGEIEVNGRVSALLELGAGFRPDYTGRENVYLNGRMMGIPRKEMEERVPQILEFADIGDFIDQPVKIYSSGMFARLAFAVAINVEPDILIVDEALSVGDLFFQNKCFKKFEELKEKNVTILFVSHDISSVRQMCSRVVWLEHGTIRKLGAADEVCDAYMDQKRKDMNGLQDGEELEVPQIEATREDKKRSVPGIHRGNSDLLSEEIEIVSCYLTDTRGNITTHLVVDGEYEMHVLVSFKTDKKNIIVGFLFENNKGLPIYDINNYINQQEGITGHAGEVTEVVYSFCLPRLQKGTYIVGAAVAEGVQEKHTMHTWLHGIGDVEIVNPGFNSSYIEIPAQVDVKQIDQELLEIV